MANSYVLLDRSSADKWAVQVNDGILTITSTTDASSNEPVFNDILSASTYYRLFIDGGIIAIEEVSQQTTSQVILNDLVTGVVYSVIVEGGILAISQIVQLTKYRVVKIVNSRIGQSETLDTSRFKYNQIPVESTNGVRVLFTLPNSDNFVSGLVEVFVNGNQKTKDTDWQETGTSQITFIGSYATTPPDTGETIRFNYIKQ